MTVRSYDPDKDCRYLCTVALTLEILSHPSVMDNNGVKYHDSRIFAQIWILVMCVVTLEIRPLVKTQPWVIDSCVKYYLDPTWNEGVMVPIQILAISVLWLWKYDLESRSWHYTGTRTTIVWNTRSNMELWTSGPDTALTLDQGHYIPFGHGQQLCEKLSRSNRTKKSRDSETDLGYVCTVTLTFERSLWHILGSWTTIVWICIHTAQREYCQDNKLTEWKVDSNLT